MGHAKNFLIHTFEHGQHENDHIFLQIEKLSQQLQLSAVLAQLVHHMGEQEEESVDRIPQTRVRQGHLIAHAWTLNRALLIALRLRHVILASEIRNEQVALPECSR